MGEMQQKGKAWKNLAPPLQKTYTGIYPDTK